MFRFCPQTLTVLKTNKQTKMYFKSQKKMFAKINFRTLKCQCQCGLATRN